MEPNPYQSPRADVAPVKNEERIGRPIILDGIAFGMLATASALLLTILGIVVALAAYGLTGR